MSRPLPDCAYCGGSLSRCGRILLRCGDLPGAPEVGWHSQCAGKDKLFQSDTILFGGDKAKTILFMINDRGRKHPSQARVVSLLKKGEKGGYRRAYGPGIAFDM